MKGAAIWDAHVTNVSIDWHTDCIAFPVCVLHSYEPSWARVSSQRIHSMFLFLPSSWSEAVCDVDSSVVSFWDDVCCRRCYTNRTRINMEVYSGSATFRCTSWAVCWPFQAYCRRILATVVSCVTGAFFFSIWHAFSLCPVPCCTLIFYAGIKLFVRTRARHRPQTFAAIATVEYVIIFAVFSFLLFLFFIFWLFSSFRAPLFRCRGLCSP